MTEFEKNVVPVDDPDMIKNPIIDISGAIQQILAEAVNRTVSLDWSHFGVTDLVTMRRHLENIGPLLLRQTPLNFPFNVLNRHTPREAALANTLAEDHKKALGERFVLALVEETLDSEEATFIRDYLWMKNVEFVVKQNNIPLLPVLTHFQRTVPAYEKAGFRTADYMLKKGLVHKT